MSVVSESRASEMEVKYKNVLRRHCLDYVLADGLLPELGSPKRGKVREVYLCKKHVVMICSDRVSAFDHVLESLIPFKGEVLNRISTWAFRQTSDIVSNALVEDRSALFAQEEDRVDCKAGGGGVGGGGGVASSLTTSCLRTPIGVGFDGNVLVQRRVKPLPVECIVRGYLWGTMANAYEAGERLFCGLNLPEGLLRFQKLPELLFTPTTKAEKEGEKDENLTFKEMVALLGGDVKLAERLKSLSLQLYQRGAELAMERGLLFLDTKYEFGIDAHNGELLVIDEVNTPDSSRLCDAAEWRSKFAQIETEMKRNYSQTTPAVTQTKSVSELLKKMPELKVKEFSKQYVRDVLLESGYDPRSTSNQTKMPQLTYEQVVECAYRYICVYERITGETWQFPDMSVPPAQRLVANLTRHKFIKGCTVIIFAGSDSDAEHIAKIQRQLWLYDIPSSARICSAHKQCGKLESLITHYNRSIEPLLIVACAGGTDALSGTASFSSVFPVVSCPPDGLNQSCLQNPPQSSNAFILRPENVAKFALQMFSSVNCEYRQRCIETAKLKVEKLVEADKKFVELGIGDAI